MVKFKNELVIDSMSTFGELEFIGLGREHYDYDEATGEIKELERRSYDILSSAQGTLLEVNLDGEIPELEIAAGSKVDLVNPRVRMFNSSGQAKSYITADRIKSVPKTAPTMTQAMADTNKTHQSGNKGNKPEQQS